MYMIFCVLTFVLAIPISIVPDTINDIYNTVGIVFTMKNNLTKYLENGEKITGTTYIIPNNGYCRVYIVKDFECNLTCRNIFKYPSFVPSTVTYAKSFKTLEDAIIWQSNKIKKYGFLIDNSIVNIIRGGDYDASYALNAVLTIKAEEAKTSLAGAITTSTPYFGSFDIAILGFVREYRQQKHKDIGCIDIKQQN